MAITPEMVKQLREMTGAGVLDCHKALAQFEGNFDRACEFLREKGLAAAEKKAQRSANQGIIGSYIHTGSRVAALVEVNCETDFVARTPEFGAFAHEVAMQVVAAKPRWLRPEDVPAEIVASETAIYKQQAIDEGKPAAVAEKMVQGRLEKFYDQNCLLRQPYIRDDKVVIEQLIKEKIAKFGENIVIKRFVRMEVGETL